MIPTPTPAQTIVLFFGVLTFLILMFLPAIIELKKPKDPGPRIIKDYVALYNLDALLNPVESADCVEKEPKFEELILREVSAILAVLPSLES